MASRADYEVGVSCWLTLGGAGPRPEEASLFELLARIQAGGSIATAAREAGLSYRNAWGLLTRWQARLGQPLIVKERGRGSHLAPLGERLLAAQRGLQQRLSPHLAEAQEAIRRELDAALAPAPAALKISASHDLALARLPEWLRAAGQEVELQSHGSLESLSLFAEERCDVAGFHCPRGALGASMWQGYRQFLKPRRHFLLRFASRVQGLMVAAGNPLGVADLGDLLRPELRFLNRQPGSGTRLLLDLMLAEAGMDARRIAGHASVEHTHSAVAALIATGQADAGLGIEAAARAAGLDFIALVTEDYFLAIRREQLDESGLRRLLAVLQGEDFRRMLGELPGYEGAACGTLLSPDEAGPA